VPCRIVYAVCAPASFMADVMNELDPHSARKDTPEVIAHHYGVFHFKDMHRGPCSFIALHNLDGTRVLAKSSTPLSPDVREITFKV
jgi:hypothetical protein